MPNQFLWQQFLVIRVVVVLFSFDIYFYGHRSFIFAKFHSKFAISNDMDDDDSGNGNDNKNTFLSQHTHICFHMLPFCRIRIRISHRVKQNAENS